MSILGEPSPKEDLEKVLKCTLTDDEYNYLDKYYAAFVIQPEEFIDDQLIDIIREDLGKTEIIESEELTELHEQEEPPIEEVEEEVIPIEEEDLPFNTVPETNGSLSIVEAVKIMGKEE